MNPQFVIDVVETTTTEVSSALLGSLPLILVIFAALVGLGIAMKFILNWIGGRDMFSSLGTDDSPVRFLRSKNREF